MLICAPEKMENQPLLSLFLLPFFFFYLLFYFLFLFFPTSFFFFKSLLIFSHFLVLFVFLSFFFLAYVFSFLWYSRHSSLEISVSFLPSHPTVFVSLMKFFLYPLPYPYPFIMSRYSEKKNVLTVFSTTQTECNYCLLRKECHVTCSVFLCLDVPLITGYSVWL